MRFQTRGLHSIFAAVLLAQLTLAALGETALQKDKRVSIETVRSDRASGGFRAFLEIRENEKRGLRVVQVKPGGPADLAGLRVGDLIISLDGAPLPLWSNDLERVKAMDSRYSAGDRAVLELERPGRRSAGANSQPSLHEVSLTFEAMPLGDQEELLNWVAIAEKRLQEGETLYCHDIRASASESHHVCHDSQGPDPGQSR